MAAAKASASSSSSTSRESLKQQLRELNQNVALCRYAERKNKMVSKGRQSSGLTKHEEHLVLSVYIVSKFDAGLAGLKFKELHPAGLSLGQSQAERIVEDMFLKQSDDFVTKLSCPSDDKTRRICDQASSFIAEHEVFAWVGKQNIEHGVAPSSSSARQKFDESRSKLGIAAEDVKPRGAKQWIRRWRRRWPVKRGRLQRGEPLQAAEITQKVTSLW